MNADLPALRAQLRYGGRPGFVLDVALELPVGVTVLLGPSGAGKSTTLDLLAGHLLPDHGRIEIGGTLLFQRQTALPPEVNIAVQKRRIGYVMQSSALFPHFDVRSNLAYGLSGWPKKVREDRIAELITALQLESLLRRWPTELSGGERQRVALARALAPRPRALLLDEPLSAVDLVQRDALLATLHKLLGTLSIPVLYVTHSDFEQRFFTTASHQALRLTPHPDSRTVEIAAVPAVPGVSG